MFGIFFLFFFEFIVIVGYCIQSQMSTLWSNTASDLFISEMYVCGTNWVICVFLWKCCELSFLSVFAYQYISNVTTFKSFFFVWKGIHFKWRSVYTLLISMKAIGSVHNTNKPAMRSWNCLTLVKICSLAKTFNIVPAKDLNEFYGVL